MELGDKWTAVAVFVYNLAVVLTGYFAAETVGDADRVVMFLVGSGLAIVWTIYFQLVMRERLERGFLEDEEPEDAESDPRSS